MEFFAERTTGEIVPFPVDRYLIFVRQTARQIERRPGPAAEKFWKTECRRLYARLEVQGMADPDITSEIDRFALAVHAEMQRAAWAKWQHNQRGDAA
jgi:hypothetical protein